MNTSSLEVFYVSDRTGITSETFGRSLLTQFPDHELHFHSLTYIDTSEKLQAVIRRVEAAVDSGRNVLVFSTLSDTAQREQLTSAGFFVVDLFAYCLPALQQKLEQETSPVIGQAHGMGNHDRYLARIDAVNYTLNVDDGLRTRDYEQADIILVGVSRSGKTPTCLYLAMQFGIRAANYPLVEEDLDSSELPASLQPWKNKLFGLVIEPETLQRIRQARRPDSRYATLEQCQKEVRTVDALFRQEQIPVIESSSMSIEELATTILQQAGLKRRF